MFVISEMIKSSVIEILRTFSDEELLSFEEFIRTPFHNKNAMLIRFLRISSEIQRSKFYKRKFISADDGKVKI